jgi:hypothetical protein
VTEEWLSGPQVAAILGVSSVTVFRAPRSELPYEETPGGSTRGGRRRYKRVDVEDYKQRRAGGTERVERQLREQDDRLSQVERRLADAVDRIDVLADIERRLRDALDRVALLERAIVAERVERAGLAERLERRES